jgi:hypothetical protein
MYYHGQMALQIAILVAFTQLIPEHQVQILGVIKARVKVRVIMAKLARYANNTFYLELTHGLLDPLHCFMFRWVPMPMDHHSVWLVCWLGVSTFLQEEPRRVCWWS